MKPVGKHGRAHRGLITSKEEREGIYFHDSLRELNNLAYRTKGKNKKGKIIDGSPLPRPREDDIRARVQGNKGMACRQIACEVISPDPIMKIRLTLGPTAKKKKTRRRNLTNKLAPATRGAHAVLN